MNQELESKEDTIFILHLRIPHKDWNDANALGQELRDKFGCGYRIFSRHGHFDECESPTEKIEYKDHSVRIH